MADLKRILGPRLRAQREARGWTQADLAERAGVSAQYLGQIERGRRDPALSVAVRLARVLDVTLDHLAGLTAGGIEGAVRHAWDRIPPDRQALALRSLAAFADDVVPRRAPAVAADPYGQKRK